MHDVLVTVWRHGEAGSAARDADRTLTAHGVSHVTASAELFKGWCQRSGVIAPSLCTHSPLVRAQQTASLLHDALAFSRVNPYRVRAVTKSSTVSKIRGGLLVYLPFSDSDERNNSAPSSFSNEREIMPSSMVTVAQRSPKATASTPAMPAPRLCPTTWTVSRSS